MGSFKTIFFDVVIYRQTGKLRFALCMKSRMQGFSLIYLSYFSLTRLLIFYFGVWIRGVSHGSGQNGPRKLITGGRVPLKTYNIFSAVLNLVVRRYFFSHSVQTFLMLSFICRYTCRSHSMFFCIMFCKIKEHVFIDRL